jgi:hypothetical protein
MPIDRATRVTRVEIARYVSRAFPATRDDLIEIARRRRASPEVLETLVRLPDRRFAEMRDLWTPLSDVPVNE